MAIIVIGGSGLIGTRLGRLLRITGDNYKIVDKVVSGMHPARSVLVDVSEVEKLRASTHEGSTVINLAAEHRDDVRPLSLYYNVNVGGARNVCTVAREKRKRPAWCPRSDIDSGH